MKTGEEVRMRMASYEVVCPSCGWVWDTFKEYRAGRNPPTIQYTCTCGEMTIADADLTWEQKD